MYNEEKSMLSASVVDERPDFGRILETLQKEATYCQENADAMTDLSNRVKRSETLEGQSISDAVPKKEPNCLVEYLWFEIDRISRANQKMNDTYRKLSKVIGN